MNKIIIFVIIFSMISITTFSAATPFKSRVRIIDVDFEDETIKVEDSFKIKINVSKQRFLKFTGEVHVYLTFAGLTGEKVGENISVIIPRRKDDRFPINITCNISEVEADWYQETFGLKIILYEKVLGYLFKKDTYSIESIRVVSKFWEKDKLYISRFNPPDIWYSSKKSKCILDFLKPEYVTSAAPKGDILVYISNDGYYQYNVTAVVYLVEKASMNIPFIEGFGHYKKELGRNYSMIKPGDEDYPLKVPCYIKAADIDKLNKDRKFDVQAVLFAEVDRELLEVDSSSIQTLKVKIENWEEWIAVNGPWIWVVFIAALGTFLLLLVTIKLIIPFTQLKGDEVHEAVKKVRKKRRNRQSKKKD